MSNNGGKKRKEQIIQLYEFKARESCLCVLSRLIEGAESRRSWQTERGGALRTLWEEVEVQSKARKGRQREGIEQDEDERKKKIKLLV